LAGHFTHLNDQPLTLHLPAYQSLRIEGKLRPLLDGEVHAGFKFSSHKAVLA